MATEAIEDTTPSPSRRAILTVADAVAARVPVVAAHDLTVDAVFDRVVTALKACQSAETFHSTATDFNLTGLLHIVQYLVQVHLSGVACCSSPSKTSLWSGLSSADVPRVVGARGNL